MRPRVSIGMPVYNEGRFIAQTLECFVRQSFENFELIISDNASTDDTGIICEQYARKFDWIRYRRAESNLGPTPNFCYVLDQSQADFFMWASGHDLWAENYIEVCVNCFDAHSNAAIVFGTSKWIDQSGQTFAREYGWYDTRGMGKLERYFTVLWGNMNPFLGMFRTAWLKQCPVVNTVGADLIILSRLSLKGDFIHAVDTSWSRREFRHESSYSEKLERYKSANQGFSLPGLQRLFPLARLPLELCRGVIESELACLEKLLILLLLIPTLPIRYIAGRNR